MSLRTKHLYDVYREMIYNNQLSEWHLMIKIVHESGFNACDACKLQLALFYVQHNEAW